MKLSILLFVTLSALCLTNTQQSAQIINTIQNKIISEADLISISGGLLNGESISVDIKCDYDNYLKLSDSIEKLFTDKTLDSDMVASKIKNLQINVSTPDNYYEYALEMSGK